MPFFSLTSLFDLLAEYLAPMANQNLTEIEARQILEYLRTKKAE